MLSARLKTCYSANISMALNDLGKLFVGTNGNLFIIYYTDSDRRVTACKCHKYCTQAYFSICKYNKSNAPIFTGLDCMMVARGSKHKTTR